MTLAAFAAVAACSKAKDAGVSVEIDQCVRNSIFQFADFKNVFQGEIIWKRS